MTPPPERCWVQMNLFVNKTDLYLLIFFFSLGFHERNFISTPIVLFVRLLITQSLPTRLSHGGRLTGTPKKLERHGRSGIESCEGQFKECSWCYFKQWKQNFRVSCLFLAGELMAVIIQSGWGREKNAASRGTLHFKMS